MADHSDSSNSWLLLQRVWALFGLALFGATYKLWFPESTFPHVPLLRPFAASIFQTDGVHYLTLGAIVLALLWLLAKPNATVWCLMFISLTCSLLVNQHRLQPWAFHLLLGAMVFMTCSRERGTKLLRILTISIYVFSAAGKFDYQFMYTVGQQFLQAATSLIGMDSTQWDAGLTAKATLIFPAFELLVGVLLCNSKTRRVGIPAAIILHTSIMLILSPLGLNHKPGVVIWNCLFVILIPLLFRANQKPARMSTDRSDRSVRSQIVAILVLSTSVLPITEPLGKYDHWLAWGLYSPRTSRVIVNIPLYNVRVIDELEPYMIPQFGDTPFRTFDMRRWSLDELNVPIYPQDRFQLAVARHIAHKYQLGDGIEIHLLGIADRFTGQRSSQVLRGVQEIDMYCRQYFFSATPTYLNR